MTAWSTVLRLMINVSHAVLRLQLALLTVTVRTPLGKRRRTSHRSLNSATTLHRPLWCGPAGPMSAAAVTPSCPSGHLCSLEQLHFSSCRENGSRESHHYHPLRRGRAQLQLREQRLSLPELMRPAAPGRRSAAGPDTEQERALRGAVTWIAFPARRSRSWCRKLLRLTTMSAQGWMHFFACTVLEVSARPTPCGSGSADVQPRVH
mmetsp:Transcript_75999/g.180828  ORF Transcript_75999/g.180828 Transcript_75999/m.180828 type:complete len:206 (-) Transcript_75999:172-789(-)